MKLALISYLMKTKDAVGVNYSRINEKTRPYDGNYTLLSRASKYLSALLAHVPA